MTTAEMLALPLTKNEAKAATIGEFLAALLEGVWTNREFSGNRPFGDGGWKGYIEVALITAGLVEGKIDEDGYVERVDSQFVDKIILGCIREVFSKVGKAQGE